MSRPIGTKKDGQIRPLSDEELKSFLNAAKRNSKRADLQMTLCWYFGLRVGELVKVRLDDITPAHQITIHPLKGGVVRTYDIPERLWRKVVSWLRERNKDAKVKSNPYLFPHRFFCETEHEGRDGTQKRFRALCGKANLPAGHSIHDLRHTRATQMAKDGASALQISSWLRQRSTSSCESYVSLQNDKVYEAKLAASSSNFM